MTGADRRRLVLSVDYGQKWPLSDIMWFEEDQPDWPELIGEQLCERLREWAAFFDKYGNHETGLFGTEERRRWFDLEGVKLYNELLDIIGDRYDLRLQLWF